LFTLFKAFVDTLRNLGLLVINYAIENNENAYISSESWTESVRVLYVFYG